MSIQIPPNIRDYLKIYQLNIPEANSIIKNPSQVVCISDPNQPFPKDYLLTSNVRYKNRLYNAFIHLAQRSEDQTMVQNFIITDNELTEGYSPVRLFLNILDWFGSVIKINNKTQKFFRRENIPSHGDTTTLFDIVDHSLKDSIIICGTMVPGYVSVTMFFTYGFNSTQYFDSLKKGTI